ncbi:MAG: zinc metalloprotease HtpX [Acidobacteria bacterium]|nr:zinc metalloprotease HtpX [Acidobacteriota bacterium]
MMNTLKTFLLLGTLSALLVSAGAALGPEAMVLFLGLAVVMNLGAWFWSDRLVLRMHGAQPLTPGAAPELSRMVAELSTRAGIPVPKLYLVNDPQPNAFATGRNPEHGVVAVTTGLLERLPAAEVRGVIAHEIAHIHNRDILIASVAAMLAGAVSFIGNALQFSAFFGGSQDDEGGSPFGGLLLAFLAPIGATLIQLGISRQREYLADAFGARIAGDPEALASALERLHLGTARIPSHAAQPATASLFIVNPFAGVGGIARLFSTHPPMEERVARLRAMTRGSRGHAA